MFKNALLSLVAVIIMFLTTACDLDDNACYVQCRDDGPKECSTAYDSNAKCQEWGLSLCGELYENYHFHMGCSGCGDSSCTPDWY